MSPSGIGDIAERPILFSGPMVRAILSGQKTQTRRLVSPKDIARAKCAADCTGPQPEQAWADPGLGAGGYLKVPCAEGAAQRVRYRASIGDRLWVRETWTPVDRLATGYDLDEPMSIGYAADKAAIRWTSDAADALNTYAWNWNGLKWRPSIFMPRWASRISLDVTGVRVERLQDISEADSLAEGVQAYESEPSWKVLCKDGRCYDICEEPDPTQDPDIHAFVKNEPYRQPAKVQYQRLWDAINGERAAWASNPWVWVVEFKRAEAMERAA